MDATLEPLRTLEPGTSVMVLAEDQDWVRIQFYDPLLGPRIGYVERKHILIPKRDGLVLQTHSTHAASATTTLSARSWATSRLRRAPSAARITSSERWPSPHITSGGGDRQDEADRRKEREERSVPVPTTTSLK
jgi:hypothetical protein